MGVDGGHGTTLSFFSSSLFSIVSWPIFSNDSTTMGVCRGVGVFVDGVVAIILCNALFLRDLLLQVGDALATARCFSGEPNVHIPHVNLCMYKKKQAGCVYV